MKITVNLLALVVLAAGCAPQAAPVYQTSAFVPETKLAVEPSTPELTRTSERYFYVTGEVKVPGPKLYTGKTTLLQALEGAGWFTGHDSPAADLRHLMIRRRNGPSEIHDFGKIMNGQQPDPSVFPGDTVIVRKPRHDL